MSLVVPIEAYLMHVYAVIDGVWLLVAENAIRLFRIISIPSKFYYFRAPDHVISMECSALDFRCQCTQQKLQSICAVLTFDPQLKKILTFSVKDRYQLNYFICIKDFNAETITSLKLNLFSFFICSC
jgi:protoporphyrinogen oxidase